MSKKQGRKNLAGAALMTQSHNMGLTIITGALVMYLTDYAGLYAGQAGKAAAVSGIILLIGRLWDAFNDPFFGAVMDNSKVTKWGKFKPFMLWSAIGVFITTVAIFNIPQNWSDTGKVIYVLVVYLLYAVAITLQPYLAIISSLSPVPEERTKYLTANRMVGMVFAIPGAMFISIALVIGDFGKAALIFMIPALIAGLIGNLLIKEGKLPESTTEKIHIKNIVKMYKNNIPLLVSLISGIFGGMLYTLMQASFGYYLKYALGVDNFATNTVINALVGMAAILLGTGVAPAIQRKISPSKGMIYSYFIAAVPCMIMFVMNLIHPISNPVILFIGVFLVFTAVGYSYIPGSMLSMEAMDYNEFKIGTRQEGMVNATANFVSKCQSAIAGVATSAILTAIGYDVTLYQDASSIPKSLYNGLGVASFLIPAILGIVGAVILFTYPLKDKERKEMYEILQNRRQEENNKTEE